MILINGASGYVGQALAAVAAAQGLSARCLVRSADSRQRLIATLGADAAARLDILVVNSSADEAFPEAVLSGVRVVVNCAGAAHTHSRDLASYAVNTLGVRRFASACANAGVAHFIQLSSIKVYGSHLQLISADSAAVPDTPYGVSKLEGDIALRAICADSAMNASVLRFPLVYGGDARGNLARFRRAARWRLPLPLDGLTNRRSMLARSTLVDLITGLATDAVWSEERDGSYRMLLVADPQPYSTSEVFRASCAQAGTGCRMLLSSSLAGRLFRWLAVRAGMDEQLYGNLEVDITDMSYPAGWAPPPGSLAAPVAAEADSETVCGTLS